MDMDAVKLYEHGVLPLVGIVDISYWTVGGQRASKRVALINQVQNRMDSNRKDEQTKRTGRKVLPYHSSQWIKRVFGRACFCTHACDSPYSYFSPATGTYTSSG